MNPTAIRRVVSLLIIFSISLNASLTVTDAQDSATAPSFGTLDPTQIEQTIKSVADWQLAHPFDYPLEDWTMAPLYDGLISASLATGDPAYLASVIHVGRELGYAPGENLGNADSHAAVYSWLRIFQMNPEPNRDWLDPILSHYREILEEREVGIGWSWVDALYMAPPTLARLSQVTGDGRYLDLAYSEVQATYRALFDPEEHLFYRDARFFDERSSNGEKVFWSRGNGWAYAGLAELISITPPGHPSYQFYVDVFKEMTPAILAAQQPDGLWRPSMLDPEQVPIGETSGSGLFMFGLVEGVNQGILDLETTLPAIERGWAGLTTTITSEGEVNFVQPIDADPASFDIENSEPYGTGAVLAAASQLMLLFDRNTNPAALYAGASGLANTAPELTTGGTT
jgi:rhamnogalacturonyl hydrolase YesR